MTRKTPHRSEPIESLTQSPLICIIEKIRIVLEGQRGEENISELCRHEGIAAFDVLRLVEGVPGGRQAPVGGRHGPRGDVRRGEGPSS